MNSFNPIRETSQEAKHDKVEAKVVDQTIKNFFSRENLRRI